MTEFEAASLTVAKASLDVAELAAWAAMASAFISACIFATMAFGLREMIKANKDRGAQTAAVLASLDTTMKALNKTLSEFGNMRNNTGPGPS